MHSSTKQNEVLQLSASECSNLKTFTLKCRPIAKILPYCKRLIEHDCATIDIFSVATSFQSQGVNVCATKVYPYQIYENTVYLPVSKNTIRFGRTVKNRSQYLQS